MNFCSNCQKPISVNEAMRAGPKLCSECRSADPQLSLGATGRERHEERARLDALLISFPQYTTTPAGDYDTLGIVAGTAVMGANIFRDMFAAVTDVVGGRSGKYQSVVDRGREIALTEMCDEAQRRGAELVGGIRIDIEAMDNMFVISATGTALKARVQSVPRAAVHHRPSPAV